MKVNGMVRIMRNKDATYQVTYAPVGVPLDACPSRSFHDENDLARFLVGPLKIHPREITAALNGLARNGTYSIYEVWLSEGDIQKHGLGSAWPLWCSGGRP